MNDLGLFPQAKFDSLFGRVDRVFTGIQKGQHFWFCIHGLDDKGTEVRSSQRYHFVPEQCSAPLLQSRAEVFKQVMAPGIVSGDGVPLLAQVVSRPYAGRCGQDIVVVGPVKGVTVAQVTGIPRRP